MVKAAGIVVAAAALTPLTKDLLGYPFEVAPMIAAVLSCWVVRLYYGARARSKEGWLVDVSITMLTSLFTVGAVLMMRPSPFPALILGTGIGAIGAGLIRIAEKKARRLFDDEPPEVVDDAEGVRRAMEKVRNL